MPNHRLREPAGKNVTRGILHAGSEAGRHGPEKKGPAIDLYGGQGSGNMQAHGGGGKSLARYLQGAGDADFRDGIQLAAGAS